MKFQWNPNKATLNFQKHKASFEEATTVFRDTLGMTAPDPDHSEEEDRCITIGLSINFRLLMVAHTERDNQIRIISARELTPTERRQYEEGSWDER
ncbi:BrnT family toxin [bacterium]|nr:BrnT family toxin [bacterium]MBU1598842.1 BrnT family toxin [bacterium]MBU2462263.1 BrnT family toxin [bacterium]